ncbi:MAG TPA: ATP-binding protein, partial [Flavobacteriales bacterium]|nr:ATP-binding protein [Flavobacteriales bacterium]
MSETRIRVLFVDDEENNLKAFRSTFRREMDVLLANSGPEALELLEREHVHVIISDQRMPGMTGSEFLTIARQRHPKSMRMLLTGFSDLEAVIAAVNEGGIHAYCTKPWDVNDLTLKIKQAYETHTLREDKDMLLSQYQRIFDTSGDPIAIVDHHGGIIKANAACGKLLGLPIAEVLQHRFTDHIENSEALIHSLRSHRSGNEFVNVDLTLRNASGNLIDCLLTATYLGKEAHGVHAFQAVIKDISDRKQEEVRMKKLNADLDRRVAARTGQLLEALEDLGSFSYTVAHDLRSPLKNIAALSDHLRAAAQESPADCIEFADRINNGAQRMLELVDDLLRFSQTNKREINKRQVPLRELVEQCVAEQVAEARMDQVHVVIDKDVVILTDAPMLKVVLQNLLSNALKFTRTREVPEISIAHQRSDGRDLITVKDNGVGFDPKHKEQAFGIFKRLHQAEQFEGSGVGLAIVQRIVAKHGGEVWAESAVDQGTSIHIALPTTEKGATRVPFF